MRFLSLLALGAPLVSAIQFLNPNDNSTLTRGSTFDLKWSLVDTDPEVFSIYLVNFVNWPPYYVPVTYGVNVTTGVVSVRVPCELDPSHGFQFNAINGTNVYIIYAQTSKFSITGASCTDPVVTPVPICTAPPAPPAPVTATGMVRGNSTSPVPSGTPASAAAANLALAAAGNSLVAKDTFKGECPEVIGWSGGYDSPVKLTEVPRAGSSGQSAPPQVGAAAAGKAKSKCASHKKRRARRHA